MGEGVGDMAVAVVDAVQMAVLPQASLVDLAKRTKQASHMVRDSQKRQNQDCETSLSGSGEKTGGMVCRQVAKGCMVAKGHTPLSGSGREGTGSSRWT